MLIGVGRYEIRVWNRNGYFVFYRFRDGAVNRSFIGFKKLLRSRSTFDFRNNLTCARITVAKHRIELTPPNVRETGYTYYNPSKLKNIRCHREHPASDGNEMYRLNDGSFRQRFDANGLSKWQNETSRFSCVSYRP